MVGGLGAGESADRFGTPLVVYCEDTLRARAREVRRAVPDAFVAYGTKAFPNVALLRLFAEEGLGADVASLGELAFARAAGLDGDRIVVHGNAKSDEELRAAAEAGATVALDAEGEAGARRGRRREAGARPRDPRGRGRHTRGDPDRPPRLEVRAPAGAALRRDRERARARPRRRRPPRPRRLAARGHRGARGDDPRCSPRSPPGAATSSAGRPRSSNAGGGFAVRHIPEEPRVRLGEHVRAVADAVERHGPSTSCRRLDSCSNPDVPSSDRRGSRCTGSRTVKRLKEVTWVAVDGGMSDNPRPQLYGARYTALSATRAEEPGSETVSIAGLHCESGDVLIDDVALPAPRRAICSPFRPQAHTRSR